MIKKICYLAFISFVLVINVAQANSKIVYIDIDFLIKNSNIGKASLDMLETINKKNIKKLTDKEVELKKYESDLKKKQNIISSDQFNKEVNLLKESLSIGFPSTSATIILILSLIEILLRFSRSGDEK